MAQSPSETIPAWARPTADEICVATMYGRIPGRAPLAPSPVGTVREAIELELLEVLQRGPCVISFSGGRDSSALLAIALHVARREGLPEPVAVTDRYPHVPESLEDDWQRMVIEHLRCTTWEILDHPAGAHEVLSDQTLEWIERLGVLQPFNWATFAGSMQLAAGGTLVTGYGGDEIFTGSLRPYYSALRNRTRPALRRTHTLPFELLPARARARLLRPLTGPAELDWLEPGLRRRLAATEARDIAGVPWAYDAMITGAYLDRDHQAVVESTAALGRELGAAVSHPFASGPVLAAAAAQYGTVHPRGRAIGLRQLVADLLPDAVLTRASKADFTMVALGDLTRERLREWGGVGIDEQRIDRRRMIDELLSDDATAQAFLSLQAGWLNRPR